MNDPRYTFRLSAREMPTLDRSVVRRKSISASRFLGFLATYEVAFRIHMVISVIYPFLIVSDSVSA